MLATERLVAWRGCQRSLYFSDVYDRLRSFLLQGTHALSVVSGQCRLYSGDVEDRLRSCLLLRKMIRDT